jgi:threonine dehydratase
MSHLVTVAEIEEAAGRLRGVAVRTPLVPLPFSDPPLFIKPESLQPTGAFKLRGAYAAITALPEAERKRGVVTHSSGNHGQAVAYAAHALDIQAVLVLPNNAPATKVDACRALGAEIVFVEPTLSARKNTTAQLERARGLKRLRRTRRTSTSSLCRWAAAASSPGSPRRSSP